MPTTSFGLWGLGGNSCCSILVQILITLFIALYSYSYSVLKTLFAHLCNCVILIPSYMILFLYTRTSASYWFIIFPPSKGNRNIVQLCMYNRVVRQTERICQDSWSARQRGAQRTLLIRTAKAKERAGGKISTKCGSCSDGIFYNSPPFHFNDWTKSNSFCQNMITHFQCAVYDVKYCYNLF